MVALTFGSHNTSIRPCEVEEDDGRRISHGGAVAGEGETTSLAVRAKNGDVVPPLVATIEKRAGRVEAKAPRVISARPLLPDVCQGAGRADGENPDAVVQPIAGV